LTGSSPARRPVPSSATKVTLSGGHRPRLWAAAEMTELNSANFIAFEFSRLAKRAASPVDEHTFHGGVIMKSAAVSTENCERSHLYCIWWRCVGSQGRFRHWMLARLD